MENHKYKNKMTKMFTIKDKSIINNYANFNCKFEQSWTAKEPRVPGKKSQKILKYIESLVVVVAIVVAL